MNMFKPVNAKSVNEYMAQLVPERRQILEWIRGIIIDEAPDLTEGFYYNMPGYGSFKYKNYKGQEIDWPLISIASNKNYVSVYVCSVEDGEYIAEKYKAKLGKVSVGKSCIRFKRIEDVDETTLREVIRTASVNPGFVGAGEHKK